MKKSFVFVLAAFVCSANEMVAGDYLTNTNQSVNFLRNPSRDAAIGIDGVYSNPAGVAFLDDGWHMQFNWQIVHQDRDARVYNPAFMQNYGNPSVDGYRTFEGNVDVPIQPSLFLDYNKDKWSFQFGFGFIGGGGGCEFDNGVGMFENLVASMTQGAPYAYDSYMKGTSYDLGFSLGAARKVTKNLSVFGGLRAIYGINSYVGHINNVRVKTQAGEMNTGKNYAIDCDQKAFGIAPILGVDWKINDHWNVAAKYEFKTRLRFDNTANNSADFDALAQGNAQFASFLDGAETPADLPSLLTVGVQYSPIKSLRVMGGYHHYFDVDTKQWTSDKVGDTNEFSFGAEYDISKLIEVSAGYQRSMFDQEEANVSDMSFTLNSWSFGVGVGVHLNDMITLNAAYFQTNYSDYAKATTTYSRTNRVIGIGVDVNF